MILGIDPKVDYAFKYLFGRESTRSILVHVLNSVLAPSAGHAVEEVELLNPYNLQEALDDKLSILDIKARDQSGRHFNVEMQMLPVRLYEKRVLYYWSKLYQQQLHEGDRYAMLRPTISISFLNHMLFPKVPSYHLKFHLSEDAHGFFLTNDIEFHVLELPKFNKTPPDLQNGLDIWLYFLRFAGKIDTDAVIPALHEPMVLRAVEELKMLTKTDIERERYEARQKAQHDYATAIGYAREQGEIIGRIRVYEEMLGKPPTATDELEAMAPDDLTRFVEDLKRQSKKE